MGDGGVFGWAGRARGGMWIEFPPYLVLFRGLSLF